MLTMPIQEIKRRGLSVLEDELTEARIAASEIDIWAGQYSKGTADELMAEIIGDMGYCST